MNTRRELGDTLAEVASGMDVPAGAGLRATSIELTLPVEVALGEHEGQPVLLADLPRFVYRTAFDLAPSRLTVTWMEQITS